MSRKTEIATGEFNMAEPDENIRPTSRSKKKSVEQRQLILTLNARDGEIVKIEEVEKSGGRHEIIDEEFAALAGDEEVEGLFPALEHAYAAGFADAEGEGIDLDGDDDDDGFEQILLQGVGGHPSLRHEVRKLILARLIRRQLKRSARKKRAGKAHEDVGHEGDEQESGREERKAKKVN
jgi:hypothetical protein